MRETNREVVGILLAVVVLGLAMFVAASCCDGSILQATCKITTSGAPSRTQQCATGECPAGAAGSGFAWANDGEHVWVMTNRHVVGSTVGRTVWTTWWNGGHQSDKIPMELVKVDSRFDVAVGKIEVAAFGKYIPDTIPIGTEDVKADQVIWTAGSPNADWATATQGRVIKGLTCSTGEQTSFTYTPMPRFGRSGSAIYNADHSEVVGLCYLRVNGKGQAYNTLVMRSVLPEGVEAKHMLPWREIHCQGQCKPQPEPETPWPTKKPEEKKPEPPPEPEAIPERGFPWLWFALLSVGAAVGAAVVCFKRHLFGR